MLLPEKTSIDQPDRAQYNKIILPQSSLFCIRTPATLVHPCTSRREKQNI